jgi:hypothetical protein
MFFKRKKKKLVNVEERPYSLNIDSERFSALIEKVGVEEVKRSLYKLVDKAVSQYE